MRWLPRRTSRRTRTTSPLMPEAIDVGTRHVRIGEEWMASFAITGFPREVHPGWLQPLLTHPARLDVSVHIDPIPADRAADGLRKQLAKLESTRRRSAERGRLADPHAEAAADDAHTLSERLARGEGKLFRVGLYLTVRADSQAALVEEIAAVRAVAASLLLEATPTTFRALHGWVATLPLGLDAVGTTRSFDTRALAAAFPFTSPDLAATPGGSPDATGGVLYGFNAQTPGLVRWDRFAQDNHNATILGRSGAGKSYLVKLELLRSLYRGIHGFVLDPEDEYTRLAEAVGGTVLRLGSPGVRLNPFDLPVATGADGRRRAPPDALTRRALFVHTLLGVLLGELTATERATLDEAVTATYARAGITEDPGSWSKPAPVLRDLREVLAAADEASATDLAARLHPFVDGAYSGLFDGATTTRPDGHLVVLSLRDLPDELKTAGTALSLDAVWRQVSNPACRQRRLVVVDEAWLLLQQPAGAQFLLRMAKSARKHWCGLTVATQDSADVLGSDVGQALVANAATQILLRQAPQAIEQVAATFGLSDGERQFLLAAEQGQGLLTAGHDRVAFQTTASATEHDIATSDPSELDPDAAGQDTHIYLDAPTDT